MGSDAELVRKVADACRISSLPNPGILLARKTCGPSVDRLLRRKTFSEDRLSPREKKLVKELRKLKYGPLVYEGTDKKLHIKPTVGEIVRIAYTETDPRAVALAKAFRDICWKRGCHAAMSAVSDASSKRYYQMVPEHTITEMPKTAELMAKAADFRIFIGEDDDPLWSKGFEKRLRLGAPSSQRLFEIMDKRKVRWCFWGVPVKRKGYAVPRRTFERVFLESTAETFSARTLALCRYYAKKLEGGHKVHITARDGTDLTFSIKGRPVLIADGIIDNDDMKKGDIGLNIPDGEAFLAPRETTANGKILFDYVSLDGHGLVRNLWLTFKKGRAVKWTADGNGAKRFETYLLTHTGQKDRIAELGIGTNRKARFIGTTLIDEKIFGSIHIAIGNNTGAYHGKNKASNHQDMIKMMKGRGGNLTVDGKLVMKDGLPTKKI